jgi:GGDEF domain-containing protein
VAKCDGQRLAEMAERIRALAEGSSIAWWGDRIGITVSVGGCLARPGDDAASLEARAGHLLDSAQQAGGNRVAVERHSLE